MRTRTTRIARRLLVCLIWSTLAAAAIALPASPAGAHALTTGTEPASGEILDAPPDAVTVRFNEPVTPVDAATGIVAPDGDRVDTGATSTEDGTAVAIALDAAHQGTYLVVYRVVSADGHPISGTFVFSVGVETDPPSADALATDTDPLVQALLYGNRWIGYAGLALALGAGVLLFAGASPRTVAGRLAAAGLSAVAATAFAGLYLQAAYESAAGLPDVDAATLQSVMESTVGLAALLRLLLVLLALPLFRAALYAGVADDRAPGAPLAAGLVATALALIATWPLAGHPMATEPLVLAFIADGIHLGAALAWAGGIAALLLLALRGDPQPEPVRRWTALAPWLVVVLAVAGLATALLHIGSIEALTATTYGRLVMLKTGLLGAILGVAFFARRAAMRGDAGRGSLRRLVAVELGLAAVILGAVVVLVQAVPANTAVLEPEAAEEPQRLESSGMAAIIATDLYTGQVVLEPGVRGNNSVRVLAFDPEGLPFEAAAWEATYGLDGDEPRELRLIELRGGILGGEVSLPEAGRWVVTVTLTDADGDAATAEAFLDIP